MKREFKLHKQLLLVIMIVAIFVFAVSLASLYAQRVISCNGEHTCTIPIPFLIPIVASMGLFIGTLIYFLMAGKITKEESNFSKCSEIIKKLFSQEEMIILKALVLSHGKLSQARITALSNMPRLKVFRTIEKLKEKGLIEKEKQGKVRMINLKENVKSLIKSF